MKPKNITRPGVRVFTQHTLEQTDPISKTVKGEALTIKELMERYKMGMDPEQTEPQYYDVEKFEDIVNLHSLDYTDLDTVSAKVRAMNKKLAAYLKEIEEAEKAEKTSDQSEKTEDTP